MAQSVTRRFSSALSDQLAGERASARILPHEFLGTFNRFADGYLFFSLKVRPNLDSSGDPNSFAEPRRRFIAAAIRSDLSVGWGV